MRSGVIGYVAEVPSAKRDGHGALQRTHPPSALLSWVASEFPETGAGPSWLGGQGPRTSPGIAVWGRSKLWGWNRSIHPSLADQEG